MQDLEMMNDEAVATLRSKMILAAERDQEDNQDGKPAVHKLRMLPQVVDLMQKCVLFSPPGSNIAVDSLLTCFRSLELLSLKRSSKEVY